MVSNWDIRHSKRRCLKIEKNSGSPIKKKREILNDYVDEVHEERGKCVMMSDAKSEPMVSNLLDNKSLPQ